LQIIYTIELNQHENVGRQMQFNLTCELSCLSLLIESIAAHLEPEAAGIRRVVNATNPCKHWQRLDSRTNMIDSCHTKRCSH
jgi:hypothetical protein